MNKPIMLTPQDIIAIVIAICGAIITVSGAITIIFQFIKRIREPENNQNDRIKKLEEHMEKIDRILAIDKQRLDRIEYGNTVTQEALLALLDNALNKDDIAPIKEAKKKLERYLLNNTKPMNYSNETDIK